MKAREQESKYKNACKQVKIERYRTNKKASKPMARMCESKNGGKQTTESKDPCNKKARMQVNRLLHNKQVRKQYSKKANCKNAPNKKARKQAHNFQESL